MGIITHILAMLLGLPCGSPKTVSEKSFVGKATAQKQQHFDTFAMALGDIPPHHVGSCFKPLLFWIHPGEINMEPDAFMGYFIPKNPYKTPTKYHGYTYVKGTPVLVARIPRGSVSLWRTWTSTEAFWASESKGSTSPKCQISPRKTTLWGGYYNHHSIIVTSYI